MKLVVKSLVIEWPGLDGGLQRPIWGPPGRGPPGSGGRVKLVVKSLVIEWPGLDGWLRRSIWGPSGKGPPGSGGKVKLVVKSLVIEWPGLDRGLWRPIWGPSGGDPPGSGGKMKLVVKSLVIEWLGLKNLKAALDFNGQALIGTRFGYKISLCPKPQICRSERALASWQRSGKGLPPRYTFVCEYRSRCLWQGVARVYRPRE